MSVFRVFIVHYFAAFWKCGAGFLDNPNLISKCTNCKCDHTHKWPGGKFRNLCLPCSAINGSIILVFYVQVDLCPEEMGNNVRPAVALLGDINAVVNQVCNAHLSDSLISDAKKNSLYVFCQIWWTCLLQLSECLMKDGWKYPSDTEWWSTLREKMASNAKISNVSIAD